MPTFARIVMTPQQAADAVALNNEDAGVDPRVIDNPIANNLGYGTLLGQKVVPARLLNDPDYTPWWATLGSLPIHVLDDDTIFLPPAPTPED